MSEERSSTRRDAIKGAATLGVVGLAGCAGDDDSNRIVIGGTSTGSSTQQAAQAYAQAANQHSDILDISVQETDGWTANLYEYDDDNIPGMGVDNNSLAKALNDEGPFGDDPVETLPHQGFIFTSLEMHWVGLDHGGHDIESTADLRQGGHTIYPIQPGFGTRLLTQEVLEDDGLWENNDIVNVDTGDIPGIVEEENVDALALYGANGVELASWCQEVEVRSGESLYLLETDDQFEQTVEDHPGAIGTPVSADDYYPNQDVTQVTQETGGWALAGQWAFSPEIPAEATEEMARIAVEHDDTIREADPTTIDQDVESMTQTVIPEIPVHAGVADYLEANDGWNDDWQRGD